MSSKVAMAIRRCCSLSQKKQLSLEQQRTTILTFSRVLLDGNRWTLGHMGLTYAAMCEHSTLANTPRTFRDCAALRGTCSRIFHRVARALEKTSVQQWGELQAAIRESTTSCKSGSLATTRQGLCVCRGACGSTPVSATSFEFTATPTTSMN